MPELRSDLVSRGREGLGSTGGKQEACGPGSLDLTSTYTLAHLPGENSTNSIILPTMCQAPTMYQVLSRCWI